MASSKTSTYSSWERPYPRFSIVLLEAAHVGEHLALLDGLGLRLVLRYTGLDHGLPPWSWPWRWFGDWLRGPWKAAADELAVRVASRETLRELPQLREVPVP